MLISLLNLLDTLVQRPFLLRNPQVLFSLLHFDAPTLVVAQNALVHGLLRVSRENATKIYARRVPAVAESVRSKL